ncbi:MAG: phosphatidate cytidylyltransferase [Alphaproteobacteria bacterium]|nr:phosphatidate cytidylyltransferase [Alphaproteobacteria bacterium]NNF24820.1 phosphatidate cytidylyltransferase [Paracoccaceae bacterium]
MTASPGRWDDLATRLVSGATVAVIGLTAVWIGGATFHVFAALICGAMVWELARMLGGGPMSIWVALAAGLALFVAGLLPPGFALPLLIAPALAGVGRLEHNRTTFALFTVGILLAGYGLMLLRDDFGFTWMIWLALIVIATDICGYFAGRFIGGPKFWPRVSPKKTWSGTTAGWLGAALIAVGFVLFAGAGWQLVGISVALSMASQLGDIAESAVKRKAGVKDSSNLIPGHGGVFDRFDAMLGASLFLLLVEQLVDFPPVGM